MRGFLIAAAATFVALGGPARLQAQSGTAQPASPSPAARDSFAQALDKERATPTGRTLPSADRFTWGDLTVPAGATVDGPVAAAHGTVHVRGNVNGDVYAFGGDVVVHQGGDVDGSALAVRGKVILDGGHVRGEMRSAAPPGANAAPARPARTGAAAVQHALKLTAAWVAVVLLVGLGVILFSSAQLETVVQTLGSRFSTALFVGIAGELAVLPLLALLCVGLALTLVGILLIPFALVAFVLALVGVLTLGTLAAVTVAGHAIVREGPNVRIRSLRALLVGTVLLALPWFAAALMANSPWAEMILRLLAVSLTWVAGTAGLGAAMMARGGVRRVQVFVPAVGVSGAGWQTPTPIGGVIAARRPPAAPPATPTGTPR
ncbi:MAG: bactofilin family protein [Gemmatimonadaceae bacterium]